METSNIFIDSCRKGSIYVDPLIGGLSDHVGEVPVIKNVGSVLRYHSCEIKTIFMNSDIAKEFMTHSC